MVELDGKSLYQMVVVLPRDPSLGYYCHRIVFYIDYAESLLVKAEVYSLDNRLQESCHYTEIKINPWLTDADFDRENTEYDLD